MSSSQTVDLVSFYFTLHFLFSFRFIFLFSIFKTNRVRVGSQDAENEEGESRTNDVTQLLWNALNTNIFFSFYLFFLILYFFSFKFLFLFLFSDDEEACDIAVT